ncbi:MAG TPA: translation elongation factor Ts [Candidatus Azoamicus sp. OHIO1]
MKDKYLDKVKILREKTKVGFMECKSALMKSGYDIDMAMDELRKIGVLKAVSKSTRIASEGVVFSIINDSRNLGIILEVNCETDFVSKENGFIDYVKDLANYSISNRIFNVDSLLLTDIGKKRLELISRYGENINVRRIKYLENTSNGSVSAYIHGNRVGCLLECDKFDDLLSHNIAMHIVAMDPKYLDIDCVPIDVFENEKSIYFAEVTKSHSEKSNDLINKIIDGKIKDYYKQFVLYEQPFIRDSKVSIRDYLAYKLKVLNFFRLEVGEVL